jgi:hypothetical protein
MIQMADVQRSAAAFAKDYAKAAEHDKAESGLGGEPSPSGTPHAGIGRQVSASRAPCLIPLSCS